MKNKIMYLPIAIILIGMVGCSTGRYVNNTQNVNLNQTQVVLSQANFQVVKQINVYYVYQNLHNIRLNSNQLKESAYAALVKEAKLSGAQTVINVTMEQLQRKTHSFWSALLGLYPQYEQAILVSGTVIEFLPEGTKPTHSSVMESYTIYAESFAIEEVADSTTQPSIEKTPENKNMAKSGSSTTEESPATYKEYDNTLPPVVYTEGSSTYDLLRERYKRTFPKFWNKILKVRTYYGKGSSTCNRIDYFLLKGNEDNIKSLMVDVENKNNIEDITSTFKQYIQ